MSDKIQEMIRKSKEANAAKSTNTNTAEEVEVVEQETVAPVNSSAQQQETTQQTAEPVNETKQAITQTQVENLPATNFQHKPAQQVVNNDLPAELQAFIQPITQPMSMDTAEAPRLGVADWVKTSEYGMSLGSQKQKIIPEMFVTIDMTDKSGYQLVKMVRIGTTNPTYVSTTDNVVGDDGRAWSVSVLESFQSTSPSAKRPNVPYDCVKLPMTLVQDAVSNGDIIAPAGTDIGYTTSKTGWQPWYDFYHDCRGKGFLNKKVLAKITNNTIKHGGNEWGVLNIELIDVAE